MTDSSTKGPGLTPIGWFMVILVVAASAAAAYWIVTKRNPSAPATQSGGSVANANGSAAVEIGIAYGTEKERWLKWAAEEFAKSSEGQSIKVNLLPFGSLEGANEIQNEAAGKNDKRIHVWAPASRLFKETFVYEWKQRYNSEPIENDVGNKKAESLAISPMVFVMWQKRYDAFTKKYGDLSFATLAKAMPEKGGWGAIGGEPGWGVVKFGHTHPKESNSGLMTLILMAYEFTGKTSDLSVEAINDPKFLEHMDRIERLVSKQGGQLSNSTGNMMKDMTLFGPSYYDAVLVYENVALEHVKNAEGRWPDRLRLVYPPVNAWVDNPYYILNVPWSSAAQRDAARKFLAFLLSDKIQRQAVLQGFRPGNLSVPIREPDSPFVTLADYGIKDPSTLCEPPSREAVLSLQQNWERTQVR